MPAILDETTEAYIDEMQPPADPLIEEMEAYAREHNVPIAARDVAAFQTILATATEADRVLEVGTAIGYSTIQLARTGADVVSLEIDPDRIAKAEQFIEKSDVSGRIEIVEGDAVESIEELDGSFDVVFIDGPTQFYRDCLDGTMPLLNTNGLIVIDNLLRRGHVSEAATTDGESDETIESLAEFNQYLSDHDGLESLILPLDDGTGFARKR